MDSAAGLKVVENPEVDRLVGINILQSCLVSAAVDIRDDKNEELEKTMSRECSH